MGHGIVGRQGELDVVDAFLDQLTGGAAGLVVAGEPGIGKTTLWNAAAERAGERGWHVLKARPAESEASFSFAGLGDLLEPVVDEIVADLPRPQHHALEVALLRDDPEAGVLDPRTLATAVLNTLRALARSRAVVVAVDDLQWLDTPSAQALAFAARRLGPVPVGVLAARRRGVDVTFDPAASFADDRLHRVDLGPLSLGALGRILDSGLPAPLPRHLLRKVHQSSGGNPFYAMELVRALNGRVVEPSQPLPVPADLRALVSARLRALSPRAHDAVLAAACLAQPTVPAVAAALGEEVLPALGEAAEAGVIRLDGERLRFTHPLLASTAYSEAAPERIRLLHRRLGGVLDEGEERARHLAQAATGPDPDVATALDAAAVAASARGAPGAAAELGELAMALTPPDALEDQRRRSVVAAGHHFAAGDPRRAGSLLEAAIAELPSGPERARVLGTLAEVRSREDDLALALELLTQALDEAGNDPAVRVPLELRRGLYLFHLGDPAGARGSVERAVTQAEVLGDPALLAVALGCVTWADFIEGGGVDHEQLARALALEDPGQPLEAPFRPSFTAGAIWTMTGQMEEACAAFERVYQSMLDQGDEGSLPTLGLMPLLAECRRGELSRAQRYADSVSQAAHYIGGGFPTALAATARTIVSAHRGHADAARRDADEAVALANRFGSPALGMGPIGMLGFLALSEADPAACHRALGPAIDAALGTPGLPQMFCILFTPDEAEALVALGELESAAKLLSWIDDSASLGAPSSLAAAARVRAFLAAAQGELDAAMARADESVTRYRQLAMPVELGRSLLVKGQVHRRRKEKRAAKESIQEALVTFDRVGTRMWSQRARDELARVGLRPSAPTEMTPTEAQVAELVASGLTNKEVSERAFLTAKSVEGVVGRVYRKLGVRSRAELGAAMADGRWPRPAP